MESPRAKDIKRSHIPALAWEKATVQEKSDTLRPIFDAVYVDLEQATIAGLVPKPAFRVFFAGQDKEKDPAQLCKVGEGLYFHN